MRGIDEIAGAFAPDAGVVGGAASGQGRELMDDQFRSGLGDSPRDGLAVEGVEAGRGGTGGLDGGDTLGRTGTRDDIMPGGDEHRNEQPADGSGCAGEKDAHEGTSVSGRDLSEMSYRQTSRAGGVIPPRRARLS